MWFRTTKQFFSIIPGSVLTIEIYHKKVIKPLPQPLREIGQHHWPGTYHTKELHRFSGKTITIIGQALPAGRDCNTQSSVP